MYDAKKKTAKDANEFYVVAILCVKVLVFPFIIFVFVIPHVFFNFWFMLIKGVTVKDQLVSMFACLNGNSTHFFSVLHF